MSFPADSTGGNLRQSPLPKTDRIIALPPPKSNRKAKLLPTARLSQMRAFFRPHISSSCFYQIIMQEKHSYAHGNPLRTSHIAICEVNGNKQKPIQRQSNTIYLTLSQFKASKVPLVPLVALVPSANGKARSPQSATRQLPC